MQFVNKAFLEFRDVRQQEVIGKNWVEDMQAEDKKRIRKVMGEAFQKKREFSVQYTIKKGSDDVVLLSKGKPNYNHNNEFIGFIGSCVQMPGEILNIQKA